MVQALGGTVLTRNSDNTVIGFPYGTLEFTGRKRGKYRDIKLKDAKL